MSADSIPDDPFTPRESAFRSARKHSRTVRALKLVLPTLAVAVALLFAWFSYRSSPVDLAVAAEGATINDGKLVMANPKLDGTSGGRPYSMTAARAIQEIGQTSLIDLEAVSAKLPLGAKEWATLSAPRGRYDRDANTLALMAEGDETIHVSTTDGMEADFQAADLDVGGSGLKAGGGVDIRREGSTVRAETLVASEGGKILVFEGQVRVTLVRAPQAAAAAENGDGDASQ